MSRALRSATVVVAVCLIVPTSVPSPATAAPAPLAPPYDADGPRTGAAWLTAQLREGLLPGPFGPDPDYGVSIDAGLALLEVDGSPAAVDAIEVAVAEDVEQYVSYAFQDESEVPADPEPEYYGDDAGDTAKAAVFARAAGADPRSYGGLDLVTRLESLTRGDGRIFDTFMDEPDYALANTIGQGFAARALDEAASAEAGAATDFLLAQQCDEGFFRLSFAEPDAADQGCDGEVDSRPSTDATALSLIALRGQADDPEVAAAVDAATAWLDSVQDVDGSFGSDDLITTPNANSTGLAAWALGTSGATAPAEQAAIWLRRHQLVNTAGCSPYAAGDEGAVAYDDDALRGGAVTDGLADQFRRATAQALPGLRYAPDGVRSEVTSSNAYVQDGTTHRIPVTASPGDLVCLVGPGGTQARRVPASGAVTFVVRLPAGTGVRRYRVEDSDEPLGTAAVKALGAKRIAIGLRPSLVRGQRQHVRIAGLAPGERLRVFFAGRLLSSSRATPTGAYQRTFRVPRTAALGKSRLRVVGHFGDRSGVRTFKVVRAR